MRYETMRLEVPGQQTGEALLQLYLLDSLEFAPERLRPHDPCASGRRLYPPF